MYGVPGKRLDLVQVGDWLRDADRHCPDGVAAERWQVFVADTRKFLEAGWLNRALNCEWLDWEVFGVDAATPFDNPDPARTGLVPALGGRTLVGLNRDYGVIRNLEDDDCKLHSRWLQYQARVRKQKPLVLIWELPALMETI